MGMERRRVRAGCKRVRSKSKSNATSNLGRLRIVTSFIVIVYNSHFIGTNI